MTCKERILSEDYADIITDFELMEEILELSGIDACYRELDGGYGVSYVKRDEIPPLSIGQYGYSSIPKLYGLMRADGQLFDLSCLTAMGNIRVQEPPLALQGSGVIIGFIDTGIRYQEDVFRREDGSTRIVSIWDQTIQTGEPPEGFLYGTEYRRDQIDRALVSDAPLSVVPTTDTDGHGTSLASAAAGSLLGQGLIFRGSAPRADIAVVKLKGAKTYLRDYYLVDDGAAAYQENDIMEAVKYLQQMAVAYSEPVVIVLGLGTNMGSHDGTSSLDSYLNIVAGRRSLAVVVCGGNEGDKEHHYESAMPESVEVRVEESMKGFCMELWGSLPDAYAVQIRSPGGEMSPVIDFRNGIDREISFIFERTRIRIGIVPVERDAGDPLVFMRFADPTPGIWTVEVTSAGRSMSGRGIYHMWLPIEAFLEHSVTFLAPSPEVTLTEPANASQVITVSAYNSYVDGWYAASGRGYARNGSIKPELAAPGVRVPTILGEQSGSSLAAAMAAGCVAQFLEWAVVQGNAFAVDSRGTKSYLIQGASRSSGIVYPDRRWGYGRINISGTFETLARL
ncbi:MAG: S8 family peptidase [Bacteroidales bacterium]|nr:S8 family peptidase [Bacteroidales bacterium]MCM1416251.1 S8 family peptidase [bacterium]MCM1423131.1 S8 family peptidase [bacterium]